MKTLQNVINITDFVALLLKIYLAKPASWQNAKHTDLKRVRAR